MGGGGGAGGGGVGGGGTGGGGAGGGGLGGGGTGGGGDGGGGGGDGGERTDAKLAMGWTLMSSRTNVIQWVILPRGVTFFEVGIGECRRGDFALGAPARR